MNKLTYSAYNMGHPWYYLLGGSIPTIKEIRAQAAQRGYQGYLADEIKAASRKCEPLRSRSLRAIKDKVMSELSRNASRYRQLAHELQKFRRENPLHETDFRCHDIHVAMGLKYAHFYNDFAHLGYLESLPDQQQDLFGG